jgi:pyridoxine 5-phosphate synthase
MTILLCEPFGIIHYRMTKLSVNINKIATLRNTRHLEIPNLLHLGRIALEAGAHGLTVHPRPDERHIRAKDVAPVAELVKQFAAAEFNIEGNPFHGLYMQHCRDTKPTQATLVPDSEGQSTSDHGWDLAREGERVKPIIATLQSYGCRVSLFMDPDVRAMELAKRLGADRVELYTEPYAAAFARGERSVVDQYRRAAARARELGLEVNAGHDLNLENLPFFLEQVRDVDEVSIGHALIADALELGMRETIRRYLSDCGNSTN